VKIWGLTIGPKVIGKREGVASSDIGIS